MREEGGFMAWTLISKYQFFTIFIVIAHIDPHNIIICDLFNLQISPSVDTSSSGNGSPTSPPSPAIPSRQGNGAAIIIIINRAYQTHFFGNIRTFNLQFEFVVSYFKESEAFQIRLLFKVGAPRPLWVRPKVGKIFFPGLFYGSNFF